MNMESNDLLSQISNLRTNRSGERRAPHKPLLVLYAIGQLQRGKKLLPFSDVKTALLPLLNAYAPPVKKNRHQPELPYWHLRNDGVWEVQGADRLDRQASGFPTASAFLESTAGFTNSVIDQLTSDPDLVKTIINHLLYEHFSPSTHDDILDAVGISLGVVETKNEQIDDKSSSRRRDPNFRDNVLRAYEHRCAFSGFRAALRGLYLGCEAAHVQWHSYDGPDLVANGIALEPTIHKLFDLGVWSLTDDRIIIVSEHFTGTDETVSRVREQHGKALRDPILGESVLNPDYIRWHRESHLGGVFREPALPL